MAQSSAHDWADKQCRTSDVLSATKVSFGEMMLRDQTMKGLTKAGFETCSPIQTRAIPLARSGLDLLVQAKSGTGKTLVFAVCILESFKSKLLLPQSLVLAPTREIAVQIEHTLRDLGSSHPDFKVESFIGGLDINEDRKKMQKCTAVIGTPGRILHLLKNNVLNVTNIRQFVLDEADKLMTDSFRADVLAIGHRMRQKIQTLALSATFEGGVDRQLEKIMHQPIGVTPKREVPILLGVKQFAHVLPATTNASGEPVKLSTMQEMMAKVAAINGIFEKVPFKQCLIFLNSNTRAESYCNYLSQRGWSTDVMMSRLTQEQRLHTFKSFKNFESRILVCTDLMARGVDSENVNLVINLDMPPNSTTYLHRIGRAGRFGTRGMAVTLMTDAAELQQMRVLLGSLGGSKTFVTKFPMDAQKDNDVDIWDYHTLDVREKFFGVDDGLDARAEQESMKALRRKERDAKKKKREEADTSIECAVNEPSECASPPTNGEASAEIVVVEKPAENNKTVESVIAETSPIAGHTEKEPSILPLESASNVHQSHDGKDWDGLMAKLTSSIDACQMNIQPALDIADDNAEILSASNLLVDTTPKQKVFKGLNLPLDLFSTTLDFGITSNINDVDESPTEASCIESSPASSSTDPAVIVDPASAIDISFGASSNMNPFLDVDHLSVDGKLVAADSTNSEFNFDRLLCMLGGEPPKSANPEDGDNVIERIRKQSNQLAAAFTYDVQMGISKEPRKSILKVDANEFVPLSRKLGDSPPNGTSVGSVVEPIVNDVADKATGEAVNSMASAEPIVLQPQSQPSNIKESPWTRVEPATPAAVVDTSVDAEDAKVGASDDGDTTDEDDTTDDDDDDESADEEASLPQQLFMFGNRNGAYQQAKPNQTNWNAIYRQQLQQIQSYVQFTKDFNRSYQ